MPSTHVKTLVREKYAEAARRAGAGERSSCCGAAPATSTCCDDPITGHLYSGDQQNELPEMAVRASLGCGNPTALATLEPGDVVLDLGSGGGIDVLLSARRVGPTGKAYGLDMTDDMLAIAEANRAKSGLTNVEFLRGEIEHIPLPDNSVDVILSNCVINLSADKDAVLREAYRVLKPGGRLAVSDVVVRGEMPAVVRRSMELWVGCVAGALSDDDYRTKLAVAGFEDISLESTREYAVEDAGTFLAADGIDVDAVAKDVTGRVFSAFVRAKKPAASGCCGPSCCA
jgi:ubiquinone/menaquinone biosynthesis C-methylase UbiE